MPHKQGKIFDQAVDHDQKQGDPYIDITKAQGNPYPASAHAFNGLADHKPAAKQRRIRHKRVQHKGAQPFAGKQRPDGSCPAAPGAVRSCLLYTSDAADELDARESGKPKVFQTFAEAQKPLPNHTQISHPQETAHVKIIQRIKTYFTRHFK